MKQLLSSLIKAGIDKKPRNKLFARFSKQTKSRVNDDLKKMTLSHFILPLGFLGCGLAAAVVVFIFEILYMKQQHDGERN